MLEESEVRTIGKYEILGPLGRGSMGLVYKGRDPEIGRLVAIKTLRKVLPTQMQSADLALERFRNEARSAGNLRHPHIITIFEVSRDGDTPYIVMDYVEGDSLEAVLEKEGKLPFDRTLHYLSQVAAGLDYAHAKGVIHKDIKPGNIFVDRSHNVFILDFGIATITESIPEGGGAAPALGTPGYMSPEQILSEKIDSRTDLFSLAIVAFECLAGQRPFPGATFTEVVGNILNAKPLQLSMFIPNLPLAMEAEFNRALAKEASQRFGTAQEMIEAFSRAAGLGDTNAQGFIKRTKAQDTPWIAPVSTVAPQRPASQLLPADPSGPTQPVRAPSMRGVKGWHLEEDPGDLFARNTSSLVSNVFRSRYSPIQVVTFILGAIAVVIALVLFYQIFGNSILPASQPEVTETPVSQEPPVAVAPTGELIIPESETPPPGLPASALTDKQLLGVLMSPTSPEGLLIDALHEGLNRKTRQLADASVGLLQHDSYIVRLEAIKAVAQIGDRRIVPRLLLNLDDHDPLVRSQTAKALSSLGDRGALGYLTQKMVSEEVAEVRSAIRAAIESISGVPVKDQ